MDPSPPPAPEYIPVCSETNAQKIVLHSKRRKSRANKNKTQAKKKGRRQIDSGARKAHRNPENKHTSEKQSAEEPRGAPHEGREDEVQTTG
jgi:hypothetical protein